MPLANSVTLRKGSYKTGIAAVSTTIAIALALVLLVVHWPFTRQAVIKSLQDASSGTVEIADFHGTYFPFPGCVASGVVFRHSSDPNTAAFITVGKLTIQGSFLGLLTRHVAQIRAEELHIIISSFHATRESPSVGSSAIDEIVANGAVLEFRRSPGKPPLIFAIHDSLLRNIGVHRSLSFQVTLSNPEPPGEITTSGRFGPWKADDVGQTPVSGVYTFLNAHLGVFHGIAGILSSRGKFQGVLEHIGVQGSTETPDFEVTSSHHSVGLKTQFDAFVNAKNGDVLLQQVNSTFNKTTVVSNGGVVGSPGHKGKTTTVDMQISDGRIQDVLRMFVISDDPPMSGMLSLTARITVPPATTRFLAKVELLGDFGVGAGSFKPKTQQYLNQLSAASRKEYDDNPATVVSDLKGHVAMREGIATFSNLSFGMPGASAEMHGTYNVLTNGIDLHGILKMDSDLSKATHGVKSLLLKAVDPLLTNKAGGSVVPFKITGTYKHPSFGLDLAGNKETKASKRLQRLYSSNNTK
jgi:AsmA-like C-terminal region